MQFRNPSSLKELPTHVDRQVGTDNLPLVMRNDGKDTRRILLHRAALSFDEPRQWEKNLLCSKSATPLSRVVAEVESKKNVLNYSRSMNE